MKTILSQALRDESGQGSSVRIVSFILLALFILCIGGGVTFAIYQNTTGVDFIKWLITAQLTTCGGLLTAGQIKSAVVKRNDKSTPENEASDVGKIANGMDAN